MKLKLMSLFSIASLGWTMSCGAASTGSATTSPALAAEQMELLQEASRSVLAAESTDALLRQRARLVEGDDMLEEDYWRKALDILVDHRMKELDKETQEKRAKVPLTSVNDLRRLLDRFAATYQIGSIDDFMELFADNARSNNQYGNKVIREAYLKLFNETKNRRMLIKNLDWERRPGVAVGRGDFEVQVLHRGKDVPKSFAGKINLEVKDNHAELKISDLTYSACEIDTPM